MLLQTQLSFNLPKVCLLGQAVDTYRVNVYFFSSLKMDPAGLGDLPVEVLENIISFLDWKSLLAISRVRLLLIISSLWTIILGLRQVPKCL